MVGLAGHSVVTLSLLLPEPQPLLPSVFTTPEFISQQNKQDLGCITLMKEAKRWGSWPGGETGHWRREPGEQTVHHGDLARGSADMQELGTGTLLCEGAVQLILMRK